MLNATRIDNERSDLQTKLGIGWKWSSGTWKLNYDGINCDPGDLALESCYLWDIFPLISSNKWYLEFLADEVLPEFFDCDRFYLEYMMIDLENDGF